MRRIWRSIIILGFGIRILVGAEPPQGFFLYDFQPKKATIPPFREVTLAQSRPTVTVEIDIGDTLMGMHIRPVAVPLRISTSHVGHANLVMAYSRLPYIGGARAVYTE